MVYVSLREGLWVSRLECMIPVFLSASRDYTWPQRVMAKDMCLGVWLSEFKSQLYHLWVRAPWANDLIYLSLRFFTCKKGKIIVSAHSYKISWKYSVKCLSKCLYRVNFSLNVSDDYYSTCWVLIGKYYFLLKLPFLSPNLGFHDILFLQTCQRQKIDTCR